MRVRGSLAVELRCATPGGTSVPGTDVPSTDGVVVFWLTYRDRGGEGDNERRDDSGSGRERRGDGAGGRGPCPDRRASDERADRRGPCHLRAHCREPRVSDAADRKSTRLNSSHVAISYAVFCLKKKKKTL